MIIKFDNKIRDSRLERKKEKNNLEYTYIKISISARAYVCMRNVKKTYVKR